VIFSLQGLHRLPSVLERCEYGLRVRKKCAACFGKYGAPPTSF
jgi:hypothetical protein